ncbi:uncharacterized protein B0I36DRAFT_322206 [Microdochium trichocladiopsis]|uniref:Uncharacterized protein n=1 Tax=Microdochium trichocladiopsis TaxID=1682393 RepID=A0A9P8Y6M6_9PEZI|nr:uncharacterized protein B0I36DRAFT_322206 [Microdochium trichocladiopsis]KAH7030668.1 hypothetical protein B0I36DRAFT_322206 [Microdochium trichocladiopsis]
MPMGMHAMAIRNLPLLLCFALHLHAAPAGAPPPAPLPAAGLFALIQPPLLFVVCGFAQRAVAGWLAGMVLVVLELPR